MSVLMLLCGFFVHAQQPAARPREFAPGQLKRLEDLPPSRLRQRLESLPAAARERALAHLSSFHFPEADLDALQADAEGGIFYADVFAHEPAADETPAEPEIAQAAVPVSPFPAGLIFHSRPGCPNVLYLDFTGENVSGTAWNTSLGRSQIPAVAFSSDGDYTTFSDSEQVAIKRMWQRVAEDFAPFEFDVTTERPATFDARTAHALITHNNDANGNPNPSSTAGGVAYVNVFGSSGYANTRPAWVYANNMMYGEGAIAEAISHEIGHNLGLSHDGRTDGTTYYGGHGSGETSWGPIMGICYNRNVTQWSRGEYHLANNTQDDLAVMSSKIPYRGDDHGNTAGAATPLVLTRDTNVVSTTPENDPANVNRANKGILERNTDVDVLSFTTGAGAVHLAVNPWIMAAGMRGGNIDVSLQLYDSANRLVVSNNASGQTAAQIQTSLAAGTYYLHVRNSAAGDPLSSSPSGYTAYATIGQYFVTGYVASASAAAPTFQLTATVNNPAWGTVTPTNATYPGGSSVEVRATASDYYRFVGWTNGATGASNPLTLVLNTNTAVRALFAELVTTNHSVPHPWLASFGYTTNLETAVDSIGANGIPLWQSYIAGLNPNDPSSQMRVSLTSPAGVPNVVNWNTVSGRVYTLWCSTNVANGFVPVAGASNLPWTTRSFTNRVTPAPRHIFYRVEAR
jgi:hypothetical protein